MQKLKLLKNINKSMRHEVTSVQMSVIGFFSPCGRFEPILVYLSMYLHGQGRGGKHWKGKRFSLLKLKIILKSYID